MKNVILNDPQQLERRLLKLLERHGGDGRAITLESLAANIGMQQQAKDLLLALANLVTRGLVKRAGDDPIPGSPVAFRLVCAASPHDLSAATSAAAAIMTRPLKATTKAVRQSSSRRAHSCPTALRPVFDSLARLVDQRWTIIATS
ncbi:MULTISPECIES: hypothetical protein [Bradyrhizobium]|uniref:hypothetical protein n=1 Tax=Bradyrhizobium TaxID=374 RepID=UPI0011446452|nr:MULTISPECIES: hypothetical protein [Bradyrhizobium]QOG16350.1 hypothetical protein FOM02_02320 [Bradyrhizobium sp. SEMIA]UFW49018.1 hypothetical protein BaraCB756_43470 [Bradyrhizobium arachidis]